MLWVKSLVFFPQHIDDHQQLFLYCCIPLHLNAGSFIDSVKELFEWSFPIHYYIQCREVQTAPDMPITLLGYLRFTYSFRRSVFYHLTAPTTGSSAGSAFPPPYLGTSLFAGHGAGGG